MSRESSPLNQSPVVLVRQNAPKSPTLAPLRLLWPLGKAYKKNIFLGLLGVLGAGLSMLAVGQIFRHLVDQGIDKQDLAGLREALYVMLGVVIVLATSSYMRLVLLTGTAEQIIADLRAKVLQHLLQLDVTWFEEQKTGDLLSRFTADMTVLQVLFGTSLPIAVRNMLVVAGGLIMMVGSSPTLSLLILCMVPLILAVLMILTPRVRLRGREVQERTGAVGAQLSESLQAIREIQAFTREESQRQHFMNVNTQAIQATWRYVRLRAVLSSLIILVIFSGITGLLWFGGHQVITGQITAGQLSAFVFYALLVAGSVGALSEIYSDLQRAAGAIDRIQEILQARSKILPPAQPQPIPKGNGEIIFDHVSFSYPTRPEVHALNDLSITLRPGENVALVGPSGSGKTTFFNLLLRLYDPVDGRINLDGVNIRELDPLVYRGIFGLVPQDPTLFSFSIRDNIAFADPNADENTILAASKAAGAHNFITSLPNGYGTILGERGTRLSGGQAQRIALARALLRDPKILLLDEATAHLDSETERVIQHALATTRKNRTTLIIAHRLSTIQHADRILVLEHGKLVADGTHQELVNTSPLYQKLAATQFSGS
jgi:ATP-binding cassette subfamily B protein